MINIYSESQLVQKLRQRIDTHALPYSVIEKYPNKEIKFSVGDGQPFYIYPTNKGMRTISTEIEEHEDTHLVYVLDGKFVLVEKGSIYDVRPTYSNDDVDDELAELKRQLMEDEDYDDSGLGGLQIRLVGMDSNSSKEEESDANGDLEDESISSITLDTKGLPDGTDINSLPTGTYKVEDTYETHNNAPKPPQINFQQIPRDPEKNGD